MQLLAADLEICLELLLHCLHAGVLHVLQAVYHLQVPSQSCPILLLCVLQISVKRLSVGQKPTSGCMFRSDEVGLMLV